MEFDAEFLLKLASSIDDLSKKIENLKLLDYVPRALTIPGSAIAGSSGNVTLNFGKPPRSTLWNVVGITLVGSDDHTTIAGSLVSVYSGSAANPSLGTIKTPGSSTVPFTKEWNKDQFFVDDAEEVFALITGLTNGQQVTGNIRVLQYNKAQRWAGM